MVVVTLHQPAAALVASILDLWLAIADVIHGFTTSAGAATV